MRVAFASVGTPADEQIGRSVAAIRGSKSQQWVADEMRRRGHKWSQATVWSVEKGDRPLRLAEAVDLADLLGRDLDDLTASEQDAQFIKYCRVARDAQDRLRWAADDLVRVQQVIGSLYRSSSSWSEEVVRLAEGWLSPDLPEQTLSRVRQERSRVEAEMRERFGEDDPGYLEALNRMAEAHTRGERSEAP